MAGRELRDPGSVPSDPSVFRGPLNRTFKATRVAWCPDLGGLPLDPRVRATLAAQRKTFEALGCIVDDARPHLTDADSIFLTMRGLRSAATYGSLLTSAREQLKPEAIGEIEAGLALSSGDVARAMVRHGQLLDRTRRFQETYEFIVCAVNQLPPFDATLDWPKEIEREDGALRGVDEVRVLDHGDVPAGDLGAGGVHQRRPPGRRADRGQASRRLLRLSTRVRIRAGDADRTASSAHRVASARSRARREAARFNQKRDTPVSAASFIQS
jgi:hypothetical protein